MAKYMTKREAMRKRAWFRAIAGLMDFFASVGSFIVILLCVALMAQLFVWLRTDITQTLHSIESVATDAIVQPEHLREVEQFIAARTTPVPAAADMSSAQVGGSITGTEGEVGEEGQEGQEVQEGEREEGTQAEAGDGETDSENGENTTDDEEYSDYYGEDDEE